MSIANHSPIIILDELDALRANATTGTLSDLRGKVQTLDTAFQGMGTSSTKTLIHNFLVQVQGCLVGDTDEWSYAGSLSSTMDNFNETADDLLDLI